MGEFVLLFAISLNLKVVIDLFFDLLLMKDVAKLGYKFKKDELRKFDEELDGSETKGNFLNYAEKILNMVPIINVLISLHNGLKWQINRERYLRILSTLDTLDTLNPMEEDTFEKNPTMVSAYKINKDLLEIPYCSYKVTGKIYYYIDDRDICYIIKVEGDALELSLFEQRDYVRNDIQKNMPYDIKRRIKKR